MSEEDMELRLRKREANVGAAKKLAALQAAGMLVLHLESMTIGSVVRVYEDGCWCWTDAEGKAQYANPTTEQKPQVDDSTFYADPIAVLDTGDAFWVRPSSFLPVPADAGKLHESLVTSLKQVLAGFAIAARGAGVDPALALGLAKAAFRAQLRQLVPAGGDDVVA